jgi:hypothetical protein
LSDRLLDLSPERAEALIDAALERRHALRLHEDAAPLLEAIPEAQHPLVEMLLAELARLSARVEALEQMQRAASRSREEMLRLDPLRFIPKSRLDAARGGEPAEDPGPFAFDPAAPDFTGTGWWPVERTEGGALRWSGASRMAAVLLPALGGGDLLLTLSLRSPYGVPLDMAEHDLFLDGVPLDFATLSNDGAIGIFEARARLPELPAGSRIALLLHGPQHEDPAPGPKRDPRRLGLGLAWARLERVG